MKLIILFVLELWLWSFTMDPVAGTTCVLEGCTNMTSLPPDTDLSCNDETNQGKVNLTIVHNNARCKTQTRFNTLQCKINGDNVITGDITILSFMCGFTENCTEISQPQLPTTIAVSTSTVTLDTTKTMITVGEREDTQTPTRDASTSKNERGATDRGAAQPQRTTEALPSTNEREVAKCVSAIIGLGAVVSLLLVVLVVVTTGWVWTCWIMKKRGGFTINSKQDRNINIGELSNPTYDRNDRLTLQLPAPAPTYETITPHTPVGGTKLELAELEEHDYDDVDTGTPETEGNNVHVNVRSVQRSNRKLGLMENNSPTHKKTNTEEGRQGCGPKIRVASRSDNYPEGDLKENGHRCDDISTEFTLGAAVSPVEEARSDGQVQEIGKRNAITNSLVGNSDKGSDRTSSEHDYYELESGETGQEQTERDLSKNQTTVRDKESDRTSSEHDYYELENGETGQEEKERDLPKNQTSTRDYETVDLSGNATET